MWGVAIKSLSSWLTRYEDGGPKALEPQPRGRQAGGFARQIAPSVCAEIVRTKRRFPDFGLRRVRDFLARFHGVRVSQDAVLRGVGDGFRLAQQRLVPARLTHCMRWLGLAARTLEMCKAYLTTRESFGKKLAQHQMIQQKVAHHALGIHAGNLMTYHCASMLEKGLDKESRPYSSMAKLHVAQLLCNVLDDAIQMHGGLGYSEDVPFSTWYRYARSARIADGPDEVHEVVIARDFVTKGLELLV